MRTSILLAAATATTLVLLSVGPSAMAQSMGGPMMSSPPPKATKAPARRGAVAPRKRPAARGYLPRGGKGPGRCGTYMFWKGGKCVDARLPRK
jgi:hypothetical protein